jgi:hypothetical protein
LGHPPAPPKYFAALPMGEDHILPQVNRVHEINLPYLDLEVGSPISSILPHHSRVSKCSSSVTPI